MGGGHGASHPNKGNEEQMKLAQRRRLTDLYSRGEYIELSDDDFKVVLWVRKMTPIEAETAYLKATARRVSLLSGAKTDPPSDLYVALRGEIDDFSYDDLVRWAVGTEMVNRYSIVEAQVADEEEWKENRYLESLRERSLEEDFTAKATETPDDPEVVRVTAELARFQEAVDIATEKERARIQQEQEAETEVALHEKVLADLLQGQGDALWLTEFQRCQVWLCTYDGENKSERYFANRDEVDQIQGETYRQILAAIERIHVPDSEGKDSPPTPDSSPPSESPAPPATEVSSSPPTLPVSPTVPST